MSARAKAGDYLSLVKFSHSIFALPFALSSAWLAAGGLPAPRLLLLVIGCCVAARTAAMGFNRLVDARVDAANPRTAQREIPAGVLRPGAVALFVALSCALFVGLAAWISPLCGWLSPLVLAVLLGYSFAKRFTWAAHLWLGVALGLAPLGAWIAVRGELVWGELVAPALLAGAVLTWVAGFDLIYSCQDADFDREQGLRSIPARFGVARALGVSRLLHVGTVGLLLGFWQVAGLSWIYAAAIALAAALLVWEHRLVAPDDLSKVDMAFFTLNGWVGVGLFVGLALDLQLLSGVGT